MREIKAMPVKSTPMAHGFLRSARPDFALSGTMMALTVQSRERPDMMRAALSTLLAAGFATALLTISTLSADARGHGFGGHGMGHGVGGHGMHAAEFAGGRRHGNDTYINAASEERDRLLDKEIKSICRGC